METHLPKHSSDRLPAVLLSIWPGPVVALESESLPETGLFLCQGPSSVPWAGITWALLDRAIFTWQGPPSPPKLVLPCPPAALCVQGLGQGLHC